MPITFTPTGQPPVTIEPIPGTLQYGGGHDDRGGNSVPNVRAGAARRGTLQCLLRDTGDHSYATLQSLRSGVGPGTITVTGDAPTAVNALLDLAIQGDAVQTATLTWKGTTP